MYGAVPPCRILLLCCICMYSCLCTMQFIIWIVVFFYCPSGTNMLKRIKWINLNRYFHDNKGACGSTAGWKRDHTTGNKVPRLVCSIWAIIKNGCNLVFKCQHCAALCHKFSCLSYFPICGGSRLCSGQKRTVSCSGQAMTHLVNPVLGWHTAKWLHSPPSYVSVTD